MVIGLICLYAVSCELDPDLWQGVLDITSCDKVCQLHVVHFFNRPIKLIITLYIVVCNWNIVKSSVVLITPNQQHKMQVKENSQQNITVR